MGGRGLAAEGNGHLNSELRARLSPGARRCCQPPGVLPTAVCCPHIQAASARRGPLPTYGWQRGSRSTAARRRGLDYYLAQRGREVREVARAYRARSHVVDLGPPTITEHPVILLRLPRAPGGMSERVERQEGAACCLLPCS
ncbi:hypothetical protein NDU88_000428 [Pleurodeles waltl]|uniref:Uncharacterized protein n=1 Tax=Pleurodeles waltl TaxID=8319 RepID=A0AAV7NH80_PLEWA|nr:hypothetical protein NDU88_000428 [Pleurodeles waltl]